MFKTCLNSPSHELTRWPVDPLTRWPPWIQAQRHGQVQSKCPSKGGEKKKKKKRNPKETKNFGKRTFAQKLMHRVSLHCFLCFGILRSFCILQTLHLWSVDRAQHFQDEFASVRNTSAFPQSESTERRELELSGSPCWVGCQISSEFARKHWQIELILQRRWSCKTGWRTRNVFNRNGNGNGRQHCCLLNCLKLQSSETGLLIAGSAAYHVQTHGTVGRSSFAFFLYIPYNELVQPHRQSFMSLEED